MEEVNLNQTADNKDVRLQLMSITYDTDLEAKFSNIWM